MQSREKFWTAIAPDCWELNEQKKIYSIGRLHIEVGVNERTGMPVKKVVLSYPFRKTFPEGYAASYADLFGDKAQVNSSANHQREQVQRFPRQNDKYFLCKKVSCGIGVKNRLVSMSDSEASIYMLTGGDLRMLTLEQAQGKGEGWFDQHVAPYLIKKKDQWYTKLEKIVAGQFKLVSESVDPADVRVYYAPHAAPDAVRVVVTRVDRPYFIMKANGCRFDASPSALALVAPKRPEKKKPVEAEQQVLAPAN